MPKRQVSSSSFFFDLTILTITLSLFYFYGLGHYPLFTPDEGRYSEVAREMLQTNSFISPRVNGVLFFDKPILFYWLEASAIKFFGLSEWSIRFFPTAISVLGCLYTYITARLLFDRSTGLLSALILATSPLYFGFAHYANLDNEVAILIAAALLSFIVSIKTKNLFFTLGIYFFSALAVLTKGLIGIVFPGVIALLWLSLTAQLNLIKHLKCISGFFLFCIIVLPWFCLVQYRHPSFFHYFFITQHFSRFLSIGSFNNQMPIWFYLPVILLGFFPWSSFLPQALYSATMHRIKNEVEFFFALWALVIFIFFSIPSSKMLGYILPIFPALSILVSRYLLIEFRSLLFQISKSKLLLHLGSVLVIPTAFIILLFLQYEQKLLHLPRTVTPHLFWVIILCGFYLLLSCVMLYKRKLNLWIFQSLICNVALLAFLIHIAPDLNTNSSKPLVRQLLSILKPTDTIINYYKFYTDIPIYTKRPITLVANWQSKLIPQNDNWIRELSFGKRLENPNWLISEKEFWQKWQAQKRLFVFLNENYLEQFKSHTQNFYILGKTNNILLVCNQP